MERTSHLENVRKVWDSASSKEINQQQAILLYALQVSPEERQVLFEKIAQWVLDRMYQPHDGYSPQKNVDYFDGETPTEEELVALIKPLIPTQEKLLALIKPLLPTSEELQVLIQPLIPFVKDGEDGVTPGKDALVEIMRPLIKEMMTEMVPLGTGGEMAKPTYDQILGVVDPVIRELMGKQKRGWFGGGGGGDMVRAGTNVTITTNGIGAKVINVTGTGSTVETPTGTVNGSNTVFTVTAEPKWIVSDGVTYYDGAGYTYAALTVTLVVPPSQYIRAIL